MEGQHSEEYCRGYAAAKAELLAVRAACGTKRGEILCDIGSGVAKRAKELEAMLARGENPRCVAARLLVELEFCADLIIKRGLSECDVQQLPTT